MAAYNIEIEDSAGNKYYPRPDLLTTKEQVSANTASGKSADALVVKGLINNIGDCKVVAEGSGASTKYYIQKGADTASKKLLGNDESSLSFYDVAVGYTNASKTIPAGLKGIIIFNTNNKDSSNKHTITGGFYKKLHDNVYGGYDSSKNRYGLVAVYYFDSSSGAMTATVQGSYMSAVTVMTYNA